MNKKTTLKDIIILPIAIVFLGFVVILGWIYLSCDWVFSKLKNICKKVKTWLN